jgi:pyruvate-ferredoxin/flavodoxin oxidoreductase
MSKGVEEQKRAVASGHWPLFRYNPGLEAEGKNPFVLDSQEPSLPYAEYAYGENRFKALKRSNPKVADELMKKAQASVERRWRYLKHLTEWSPSKA